MISKKKRLQELMRCRKVKSDNAIVMMHYFNPIGIGDWYITHAEKKDGDYLLTGLVHLKSYRWREFTMSDLLKTKLPFGEKVKYNSKFIPCSISCLKSRLDIGKD